MQMYKTRVTTYY